MLRHLAAAVRRSMKSSRQVSQGQERPALTTGSMQGRSALCLAEAAEQQAIRAMAAQPGKMSLEEYVAGASLHFMAKLH